MQLITPLYTCKINNKALNTMQVLNDKSLITIIENTDIYIIIYRLSDKKKLNTIKI